MWYLEVIGETPEPFTHELALRGIDEATLKDVLKKANPVFANDQIFADEPLDPVSYEVVNLDALSGLTEYLEDRPEISSEFQYCVTFYDD